MFGGCLQSWTQGIKAKGQRSIKGAQKDKRSEVESALGNLTRPGHL